VADVPYVALIAVITVNVWIGIPFNVTLLYSGLKDIPVELYEGGALDGATGWKAYRKGRLRCLAYVLKAWRLTVVVRPDEGSGQWGTAQARRTRATDYSGAGG
jgi:ABC-type polysaccharide transport system permease subunit